MRESFIIGSSSSNEDRVHSITTFNQLCRSGNLEAVKAAIDAGANIHAVNRHGETPLHIAAGRGGNTEVVQALLSAGANIHAVNRHGETPLHIAAGKGGSTEIVQALLSAGANIHAVSRYDGDTPLHIAAGRGGNTEVVQALLSAGANINAVNRHGETPLHIAAGEGGSTEIVQALLSAGANIHAVNRYDGDTPLHIAAGKGGSTEIVQALLSAGANIHAVNRNGYNPLHHAALYNSAELVKVFLSQGADVNAKTKLGYTPLNCITDKRSTEVAKVLLSAGAYVDSKDNKGDTLINYAAKKGYAELVKYLVAYGAKYDFLGNNFASEVRIGLRAKEIFREDIGKQFNGTIAKSIANVTSDKGAKPLLNLIMDYSFGAAVFKKLEPEEEQEAHDLAKEIYKAQNDYLEFMKSTEVKVEEEKANVLPSLTNSSSCARFIAGSGSVRSTNASSAGSGPDYGFLSNSYPNAPSSSSGLPNPKKQKLNSSEQKNKDDSALDEEMKSLNLNDPTDDDMARPESPYSWLQRRGPSSGHSSPPK